MTKPSISFFVFSETIQYTIFLFLTKTIYKMESGTKSSPDKLGAVAKDKRLEKAHTKWKAKRQKRRSIDYSSMSYWQKITTCTAL